jgi:hypothetical protein
MLRILPALLLLSLASCTFKAVSHSSKTAARDSNLFLKALYVDHNYDRTMTLAHEELRKMISAEKLAQLVEMAEKACGVRQEFKAESYQMVPNQGFELFYVQKCEKTTLYHRTIMVGDTRAGYRVAGVWFQDKPYPENQLRHKFDTDIVVE